MQIWQPTRKGLSKARQYATWSLLRVFGVEVSFDEVAKRAYPSNAKPPCFFSAKAPSIVMDVAKSRYEEAQSRRDAVIDKCKTLLAISALLLPMLVAVAAYITITKVMVFPAAFLLVTAFLILNVLDIGEMQHIVIDEKETLLDEKELQKCLANSYASAALHNDAATDYLVDVMRVARMSLVLGLVVFAVVGFTGVAFFLKPTSVAPAQGAKGPEGDKGVQGDKGLPGDKGPQGDKGIPGDKGPQGEPVQTSAGDEAKPPGA